MRRKEFKQGFVLSSVSCSNCTVGGQIYSKLNCLPETRFFELKEALFFEVQIMHESLKPAACNGNLTIVFDQAVREVE